MGTCSQVRQYVTCFGFIVEVCKVDDGRQFFSRFRSAVFKRTFVFMYANRHVFLENCVQNFEGVIIYEVCMHMCGELSPQEVEILLLCDKNGAHVFATTQAAVYRRIFLRLRRHLGLCRVRIEYTECLDAIQGRRGSIWGRWRARGVHTYPLKSLDFSSRCRGILVAIPTPSARP